MVLYWHNDNEKKSRPMNKSIFIATTILIASFLFTGCQSKPEPAPVVEAEKHDDVQLLIHVDYFKGKKCQQKVSPEVYEKISEKELHLFVVEPDYIRHHDIESVKSGKCDNVVMLTIDGEVTYICGGHTSSKR